MAGDVFTTLASNINKRCVGLVYAWKIAILSLDS